MSHPKSVLAAAALSAVAMLCTASFSAQAAGQAERTRVIVSYKAGSLAAVKTLVARLGGKTEVELDEVDAVAVTLPKAALAALRAGTHVRAIEADPMRKAFALGSGSATQGQTVPYGIPMVQADQLPASGAKWSPTVCIVDSGIDGSHEDLSGNTLSGKNFTQSGAWNTDEAHHGTHVAGTIAALNNALGVVGVAGDKQLKLRINKVFDASNSAPSSTIAKAMIGCMTAKANVVSMSLGGGPSTIEGKVVSLLASKNMLLVAAAGNGGSSDVSYPAGFPEVVSVAAIDSNKQWASFSQFNADVEIAAPGVHVLSSVPMGTGLDTTLTVAGTSFQINPTDGPVGGATAPLYNFGTGEADDAGVAGKVCLIQRGNISFGDKVKRCQANGGVAAVIYNNASGNLSATLSGAAVTIPSGTVSGEDGAVLLTMLGQSTTLAMTPSNYAYFDGTSMATPHVSAVAARVWSYFPECTAAQIRDSLDKSAQDLGDAGRDVKFGFGLVQAKSAYDRIAALGCGN